MNTTQLFETLAQGEGACIEFKSSFQKEVAETFTAFANNDSTIKVFDDRIEFFNPGALLDDLTVEKIKTGNYKSHLRNKQIATIFKELDLIEKYGSGVRRVIDTFVAYGLPEPEFEATQGGMAVTVFKALEPANGDGANVGANVGANGLLAYIQANPGKRAVEMAVTFNVTQRTIERWLKQLKENGLIEFRGATKTGGYHAAAAKPAPLKGSNKQ